MKANLLAINNREEPPRNVLLRIPWMFRHAPILMTLGCLFGAGLGWFIAFVASLG